MKPGYEGTALYVTKSGGSTVELGVTDIDVQRDGQKISKIMTITPVDSDGLPGPETIVTPGTWDISGTVEMAASNGTTTVNPQIYNINELVLVSLLWGIQFDGYFRFTRYQYKGSTQDTIQFAFSMSSTGLVSQSAI